MLFTFLLVVQAIVAAALIGVILMQKSEGGGLGVGGSPAGFLSARGAADFLTRATAILAGGFIILSITLAVLASVNHSTAKVDADAAAKLAPPVAAPAAGAAGAPAPGGAATAAPAPAGTAAPTGSIDPLAGAANAVNAQPAPKGVPLQQ